MTDNVDVMNYDGGRSTMRTSQSAGVHRAEIRRQLLRICPIPLSDDALERAARYVETHRDQDALAIVNELSRLDAEARVCRGQDGR